MLTEESDSGTACPAWVEKAACSSAWLCAREVSPAPPKAWNKLDVLERLTAHNGQNEFVGLKEAQLRNVFRLCAAECSVVRGSLKLICLLTLSTLLPQSLC